MMRLRKSSLIILLALSMSTSSLVYAKDTVVKVNGIAINFTGGTSPIVKDGTTYIPLRALSEQLGASLQWEQDTQTIRLQKNIIGIKIRVGSYDLTIDGARSQLNKCPIRVNGTVYVPLKEISKILGSQVSYEAESKVINITAEKKSPIVVTADTKPTEALFQNIDLFKNTFKGIYNSKKSYSRVLIVSSELFKEAATNVGVIEKIYYKGGMIYIEENPRIKEQQLGSTIYFSNANGINRMRYPSSMKLANGNILSEYKEVSQNDFSYDRNYLNLSIKKNHVSYIVLEHQIKGILIAIPISEIY